MVKDVNHMTEFNYPKGHLTGTDKDNGAEQTQYNNTDYADYEKFLQGWIDYYTFVDGNETMAHYYNQKLVQYQQETKGH